MSSPTAISFPEALRVWIRVAMLSFGAPYVESLRGNRQLSAALSAIMAAVVGVILNLAIWFALHVMFTDITGKYYGPLKLLIPEPASIQPFALLLSTGALIALPRYRTGMIPTLVVCALLGMIVRLAV